MVGFIENHWNHEIFYKGWKYVLIFGHNSSTGLFYGEVPARYYVNESDTSRYSILSDIDSFKRANEKYEFLLCYPDISVCNRWEQTISPIAYNENETCEIDKKTIGFRQIDLEFQLFKGLMLSSNELAYLDGDCREKRLYRYAIGSTQEFGDSFLPGPVLLNNGTEEMINVQKIELYLKVFTNYPTYAIQLASVLITLSKSLLLLLSE